MSLIKLLIKLWQQLTVLKTYIFYATLLHMKEESQRKVYMLRWFTIACVYINHSQQGKLFVNITKEFLYFTC